MASQIFKGNKFHIIVIAFELILLRSLRKATKVTIYSTANKNQLFFKMFCKSFL